MSSMMKAGLFRAFYLTLCMSRAFLIRQNHRPQPLEEICESASFLSFPRKAVRPAPRSSLRSPARSTAPVGGFTSSRGQTSLPTCP